MVGTGGLRTSLVIAAVAGTLVLAPTATVSADHLPFDMYDVDGNGELDGHVLDWGPNGVPNGVLDQNHIDVNTADDLDGDTWLIDKNENRVVDEIALDLNANYWADAWVFDNNEDGALDDGPDVDAAFDVVFDNDQDGNPDGLTLVIVPESPFSPTPPSGGISLVITPPKLGSLEDIAANLAAGHANPCAGWTWTAPDGWVCVPR